VPPGYNPVAALMEKPSGSRDEAAWLEVPQAALLLEAARTNALRRPDVANPNLYELLSTFLLTGGRASEVYGLDVADIVFDRRIIHFRPNRWRRLKTKTSRRTVPLWPQLEEVLRAYVFGGRAPRSGLLFPSSKTGRLITDIRKALGTLAKRAGFEGPELRTKAFRHTYCAARLQTLDRGAPVSVWTVTREMGHGGRELVDRVYGHLGTIGERLEVVEYRVDPYLDLIGTQVADLRAGIY
jgi:integrase